MWKLLLGDLRAARERDPAARSALEVIICYPGVHAIWGHRIAHRLWKLGLRLPARMLSAFTRVLTGVDIHPGATIGPGLFIDHATGVVIGETAEIGRDVTIYHGVTLGGVSLERAKRHPTVGDNVLIGAGAKILGPVTIGEGSRVGANAVVVKSVPPGSVVVGVPGRVISRDRDRLLPLDLPPLGGDGFPDPFDAGLRSLLDRVEQLESTIEDRPAGGAAGRGLRPSHAGARYEEDFVI